MKKLISIAVAISMVVISTYQPVAAREPDGNSGAWADGIFSYLPAARKDGTPVAADQADAWQALGIAESFENPTGAAMSNGVSLGIRGQITLSFANTIVNTKGKDLKIFELNPSTNANGQSALAERVKVEVSQNGWNWYTIAGSAKGNAELDLGPIRWARYVQLTDKSTSSKFDAAEDGFDLDGVVALHTTTDIPWMGTLNDKRFWFIDDNADNDSWLGESIKSRNGTAFCNDLWDQAVTLHNNWEANPTSNGVSVRDTFFYTVGRSSLDFKPLSEIHGMFETFTCTATSRHNPELRELLKQLKVINKGQNLWYPAPAA